MTKTVHDKLCAGLEAMGAVAIPHASHYKVYRLDRDTKGPRYYFVGKIALRVCNEPLATKSLKCNETFRRFVMETPNRKQADQLAAAGITI